MIQKRKGEWRVDFQKPLGITVCLYCQEKKQEKGQQGSRSHGVEVGRNGVTGRSKGQKMEGGCKWRGHFGSCRSLLETTEIM